MTSKSDRIAIEDAAHVLRAICDYAQDHPAFAESLKYIPVPGGHPMLHFASRIGAVATRHPTDWVLERRRESDAAA